MIVDTYTWVVPFVLSRVVDGDTQAGVITVTSAVDIPVLGLTADVSLPIPVVVRLEGVNTPEMKTHEGKAVKLWVVQWYVNLERVPLYLGTNGKRDSFGRLLGDVRQSPSYLTGLAYDLLQNGKAVPFKLSAQDQW